MRCVLLAFAAGVACLQTCANLPSLRWCVYLLLALLLAYIAINRVTRARGTLDRCAFRQLRLLGFSLCAALAGFVWAALYAHYYLRDPLPTAWEGRDITLIGSIADLPRMHAYGQQFVFAVERVLPQTQSDGVLPSVPTRLLLSWYARGKGAVQPTLAPGARWQFTVRLKRPHGNANPHGFDAELWLLQRHIGATGYVRVDKRADPSTAPKLLNDFVCSLPHLIARARGYLRSRILTALPEHAHAGVIVALVIGEQRAITANDWEVFRRTGVNHLVAISGLHISLVAGLCSGVMLALWRRSSWLTLRLPAQKAALLAAMLSGLLYVALAGFGIPAQRALTMLLVLGLAFWRGRIGSASQILCLALGVVVLIDPWAVLGAGFLLSFACVALILYCSVGRSRHRSMLSDSTYWSRTRHALGEAGRTQWALSLGLLPLTMLLFAQTSLLSPLANALAIPVVTLLVAPLALLSSVLPLPLATYLLTAAHGVLSLLIDALAWLAASPLAVWQVPLPSWSLFVIALLGSLLLLAPRGWPLRWLGLCGWLPLLLNVPTHPRAGVMWVTAFDVGQGMALLIETAQHRLLYDTGPPYGPTADAGTRVILPYLQARGIRRLDAMVVSHSDSDHAGGALSILQALPVATVYASMPASSRIAQAASHYQQCSAGQHWQWDGMQFAMLHPTAASYESDQWSPNARSCVLKVSTGTQAILLPGDIGAAQERQLLQSDAALQASVLLAPHHGSKTSSSLPFLRAVDPALAIFQVGYRNRYQHPEATVDQRYHDLGIVRLRSDRHGAIALQFGATLEYQTYRQQQARYWRSR